MFKVKFKYNPETLRYERVTLSIINILISGLGYLSVGALFFASMVVVQNYFIESPLEKQLRDENQSLKQHKVVLSGILVGYQDKLSGLKKEENNLHTQLFDSPIQNTNEVNDDKLPILLSEREQFEQWVSSLKTKTGGLIQNSKTVNLSPLPKYKISKPEIIELNETPTLAPIKNIEPDKLVSGFGTRVNPFHKGNYHHDGVDLAAPRGTEVLAAADGNVISSKRSELLAGYGNYIEVQHGNGFITRYTHLDEINVRQGQKIKKGHIIGTVGSTGGSTAPHLHYEVVKNGKSVNPLKYFIEGVNSDQFNLLLLQSNKINQSLD